MSQVHNETHELVEEVKQVKKKISRGNLINIFKVIGLFVLAGIATWQTVGFFQPDTPDKESHHIGIVTLKGAIASGEKFGDGLLLSEALQEALDNDSAKAVIIMANSGGGSPVQAEILSEMLIEAQAQYTKPIYFVIEEVCASACMYISSSLSNGHVIAHKNSLVGSIGIKMETFGFVEAMNKVGIERRSYTIGDAKSFIDPFKPEDTIVANHIETEILPPLYDVFTEVVRNGRGDKLSDDPRALSGLVWTGHQAVELGLVDRIGTSFQVRESLANEFDTDRFISYNAGPSNLMKLLTSDFWSEVIAKVITQSDSSIELR